jgi:tetraacyldisaccharide 4'-kinase
MKEFIQTAWVKKGAIFYLVLIPLSWLFSAITAVRRWAYQTGILKSYKLPVPVIVVGNITVGGNGKTPVVMWLVEQLRCNGFQPGVISRGYGGSATLSTSVSTNSQPSEVGDEPVLIANRCACPVFVGADRVCVATALLSAHPECNIIISDDGLQHYALKRDVEIAVTQADMPEQAKDNMRLLPAGRLREPLTRLNTVDAIVCNGGIMNSKQSHAAQFTMQLIGEQFYNLHDNTKASASDFKRKSIKAIAGIGKPARFFEHLSKLGLAFASVSFDDHYAFSSQELANIECDVLVMTEKDAVKCKAFAQAHYWVLPVQANIDEGLLPLILSKLTKKDS